MSIGERIRKLREANRLQQDAFAIKVGVHKNTAGRWERGERKPDSDDLAAILRVFPEINPTWLLTGSGPMRLDQDEGVVMEHGPGYVCIPRHNGDQELAEIVDILQHDMPEAKNLVLKVLRGRKDLVEGLEGLGMKLKEEI